MVKAELGDKQACPSCGAKFYDLRKRPAVCPKCSTAFDPADELLKLKRTRTKPVVYENDAEEEDEEAAAKPEVEDGTEDEPDETKEVDVESPDDVPIMTDEDDEDATEVSPDSLPAGFSEAEDDVEVADDDDDDNGVPILEDDDEDFDEDDLAVGDDDDDDPT